MSCTCQRCKKKYTVDLIIPDLLWEKVKSNRKTLDAGLLCGACIMARVEQISGYDYWYLAKIQEI